MSSIGLREVFQESNEKKNLPLGGVWKSIPLLGWGASLVREWSSISHHVPVVKKIETQTQTVSLKYEGILTMASESRWIVQRNRQRQP
mmetsp:Transcript_35330/g.85694  ORF Transcript_35330/g.85694 Transcript_35330/m.85694 type:complete len:88 (-) Transcript_35330:276-539(-)